MTRNPPHRDATPTGEPTTGGLLVAFLLLLAVPLALWAASEPLLVGAFALSAAAGAAATLAIVHHAGRRPDRRFRLCLPRTGVCVEL